ncbi:maltose alpha-D-glucosyltransferase [Dyadobacter sandarakinus]|uniref:Maltokinase n=1 Tax=Dyadobacter sandarakinus TaxID=2747268 RepID=A0ABX7I0K0_9BACT|nr:maltose alpha-D-glucosyltransferase [Dyadobacter sandarakinus]QRQ99553.1 maltose alpha-D-glucosyltransferase [Dyadobacter sandarakinus]
MENKQELPDKNLHWYKDAIIYELHIKAFKDGNCDGIGDFKGLMEQLDYLQDLGVTAIWLLPFYPSPLRDDGYDIADYYNINPSYGEIHEFKTFLKEAHKRGLKVITELVINHTSDQHPWFQRARKAPKGSAHRNYYVWTDNPKQYKDARIIFQDYEKSNWTWDDVAGQYYWHRFFHHQPDLNFDNQQVRDEIFKIINYWCKMGVDGFRLDAVPYLFERDGTNCENLPETHVFLKELRKHVDSHFPGTLLLAEANMWPEDSAAYFGDGDECQMNYHFPIMPRMFMSLQMEDRYPITDIFDQTPAIPENCQWGIFLRNHDELTLEMVTDEERDYMYKAYVKDPKARINLGIRHRLAPLMDNNRKKIELLNSLLFTFPGTPIIYYGDEIGMGDNFYLGDRDGVRTPMQWSPDRNAGFSQANPQRLYLPLILDPQYHYESVNVELQTRNTSSLLWWMKRAINTRKKYKAFSRGDIRFLSSENSKILSFTRTFEDETMLVVANLSRFPQPVELDLDDYKGYQPVEIYSRNKFPMVKDSTPYFFTLEAYACQCFILQKTHPEIDENRELPLIRLNKWSKLLEPALREQLENQMLPYYMMKMRWFGGKGKGLDSVKIISHVEIPMGDNLPAYILLLETTYQNDMPEMYQLPVAFGKDPFAHKVREDCPQAVIARVQLEGDEEGVLFDAVYGLEFQQYLLTYMAQGHTVHDNGNTIHFTGNEQLATHLQETEKIKPKVMSAEQSNTSLSYDGKYFFKLYRKVDRAVNPDMEITHFLTHEAAFKNIPAFVGAVEWKHGKDSMILGMMQEMVTNANDAWAYMLDRLDSFNETILSSADIQLPQELRGTLIEPVGYEDIPESFRNLLDVPVVEQVSLLGVRTAEMHLALASNNDLPDFKPEEFSLHYQRSVYSSLLSLVRSTFQGLNRNSKKLSPELKAEADRIIQMKEDILTELKKVYSRKIDTAKIRIHGDYHLGQVLFTGKDFVILDFEGEPARSYSERRLKRSALRDVAGMIRSFHYAAYGSLYLDNQIRTEDIDKLLPFVEQWYHYMSGLFMKSYLETVGDSPIIPQKKEDLEVLVQTFLLQKAIYELNYEVNNRPTWVGVPIRGIKAIMKNTETQSNTESVLA